MIELTFFKQTLFCNQQKKKSFLTCTSGHILLSLLSSLLSQLCKILKGENPFVIFFFLLCENDFTKMPNFNLPEMTDFKHT